MFTATSSYQKSSKTLMLHLCFHMQQVDCKYKAFKFKPQSQFSILKLTHADARLKIIAKSVYGVCRTVIVIQT